MKHELYDWVDDDSMDAEEMMRRFSALNPVPAEGGQWRDHRCE
jgi:hypothetical protein